MDKLILSIAIAITLGLASCTKDSEGEGGDQPPEETSKLRRPGALDFPPEDGKVPPDLRPPR